MQRAPLWARLAFRLDLASRRFTAVLRVLLEELICARVPAAARPAVSNEVFDRLGWYYLPGGTLHREGVWEWELAAIATMGLKPGDAVLVCASGGGREIDALTERGYSVRGFDPSALMSSRPASQVSRGAYDDLVRGVTHRDGPLADLARCHFDGIILGWGSMNHVLTDEDRHALFHALRAQWPAASLLVSYQEDREEHHESAQLARLRRRVRTWFGTDRHSPNVEFFMAAGFMHFPSHAEVAALAEDTGYRVAHAGGPYPHDVLTPI